MHSITTSGMPFTNSTMSGTMKVAAARLIDPELVDRQELIAFRMRQIDVANGLVPPAIPVRPAIHRRARAQQIARLLVPLHQLDGAQPLQVVHRVVDPALIQPGLAVGIEIDPPQRRPQPALQQHLAEAGPLGMRRHRDIPLQIRPAHGNKLVDQGPLNLGVFRAAHDPSRSSLHARIHTYRNCVDRPLHLVVPFEQGAEAVQLGTLGLPLGTLLP